MSDEPQSESPRLSGSKPTMFHVGTCRICGEGNLGLRMCTACDAIAIMCDECDVAWGTADLSTKPSYSREHHLPCPTCDGPLHGPSSHWATREEIAARAWLQSAIDSGQFQLSEAPAYTPESS